MFIETTQLTSYFRVNPGIIHVEFKLLIKRLYCNSRLKPYFQNLSICSLFSYCKKEIMISLTQLFQDIGDDKIQLVQGMADIIENKTRQLDYDSQNLDFGKGDEEERTTTTTTTTSKPASKVKDEKSENKTSGGNNGGGKRKKVKEEEKEESNGNNTTPAVTANNKSTPVGGKKTKKAAQTSNKKRGGGATRKVERERSASPQEPRGLEIDPDEPTYCLCDEVSYGEMIGCDNDLCPIEWFHFNCVNLSGKPKGKWFCPFCRGDKPTVMKPKAQFLKDLDKYNKEKEEKMK